MGFLGIGSGPPPKFSGGPDYNAIQTRLYNLQGPIEGMKISGPEGGGYSRQDSFYAPQDMSKTATPQFDIAREQANQQANVAGNQANEAMARRYASMGMLNSGAYAAQAGVQDQQLAQQKADTQRSIGSEQAQTVLGLEEQERQREFQAQGQTASQNFQGQMANQAQNLQAEEANAQFQQQTAAMRQQGIMGIGEMQESQAEAQYNAAMNGYTAQHSGGLFGSGGFLGMGSWLCTERGKMIPLTEEDQRLLKILLWHAKRRDKQLTRFYLFHGAEMVSRAKMLDQEWIIRNAQFINGILSMLAEGRMDEAFVLYRSHFLHEVDRFWPDCRHPYFLKASPKKELAL